MPSIRFVVALCLAALAPLALGQAAKPSLPHRVGLLSPASVNSPSNLEGFLRQLREYGYVEGRNLVLERRFADGHEDRLAPLAAELAQQKLDVIVAFGPSASRAAARQATSTMPVVISTIDAVEQGLIASLGRPASNVTGMTIESTDSAGKQLALLKEAIPGISRVGIVANPAMPGYSSVVKSLDRGAAALGLRLVLVGVASDDALVAAFEEMKDARVDAFLVVAEPVIDGLRARIAVLAAERRLPAMYPWRMYVDAGGLMSYGPSLPDLVSRLAYFVHRIITGTKPGDLPVELPSKFDLVLNLKAARDLGITFPPSLRQLAVETVQ
jgi:putative ABC transport system substrate-binding protein